MPNALPPHLEKERAAVEAMIHSAFAGVTREGGVSWSESVALSNYESPRVRAEARASDCDSSWEEVAADSKWTPEPGIGGFNFLDAIGFRYYLPAAMMWCLKTDLGERVAFALTREDGIDDSYRREQWALISAEQARCIACFLRFMEAWDLARGDDIDAECWRRALDGHWHKFDSGSTSPSTPPSVD